MRTYNCMSSFLYGHKGDDMAEQKIMIKSVFSDTMADADRLSQADFDGLRERLEDIQTKFKKESTDYIKISSNFNTSKIYLLYEFSNQ